LSLAAVAILWLLSLGGVEAAVIPRLSAEELTARSEAILQGSVVRSWAAWDDKHKYIWTHYEIAVSDTIRGAAGRTFTISEPGGTLDGRTQLVSGVTRYAIGEDAVLFLYRTPIGYWRVTGGPQGKFTIASDGRVRVDRDATVVRGDRAAEGTPLAALDRLGLGDFKTQVRRLAATHPYRERQ
jgi:hypothetical protein